MAQLPQEFLNYNYNKNIAGRKARAATQFRRGSKFAKRTPVGAGMLQAAGAKKGMPRAGKAAATIAEASIPAQIKEQIKLAFDSKTIQKWGGIGGILMMLSQMGRGIYEEESKANLEEEIMQGQMEMITPESFYQQAMLPRLQQQEAGVKQAVLGRLASGGVLGPSLAKGEYSIGG